MTNLTGQTVWLLTVDWNYDEEIGDHAFKRNTLHTSKDSALLALFDLIYEEYEARPEQTRVKNRFTRKHDDAERLELLTEASSDETDYIQVWIEPLTIESAVCLIKETIGMEEPAV